MKKGKLYNYTIVCIPDIYYLTLSPWCPLAPGRTSVELGSVNSPSHGSPLGPGGPGLPLGPWKPRPGLPLSPGKPREPAVP